MPMPHNGCHFLTSPSPPSPFTNLISALQNWIACPRRVRCCNVYIIHLVKCIRFAVNLAATVGSNACVRKIAAENCICKNESRFKNIMLEIHTDIYKLMNAHFTLYRNFKFIIITLYYLVFITLISNR